MGWVVRSMQTAAKTQRLWRLTAAARAQRWWQLASTARTQLGWRPATAARTGQPRRQPAPARTGRRRWVSLVGLLSGLLLAATLAAGELAGPTHAHSYLRRSLPAAGQRVSALSRIRLEFSQPVEQVRVELVRELDGDGNGRDGPVVLVGTLRPLPKTPAKVEAVLFDAGSPWRLAPGAYVLRWVSLGSDGHTVSGSVPFRVSG